MFLSPLPLTQTLPEACLIPGFFSYLRQFTFRALKQNNNGSAPHRTFATSQLVYKEADVQRGDSIHLEAPSAFPLLAVPCDFQCPRVFLTYAEQRREIQRQLI